MGHSHDPYFFTIPPEFHHKYSNYYLLKWARTYFLKRTSKGYLFHDGIKYFVVADPSNHPALIETDQVLLSFRKLKQNNVGSVVVKPAY